MKRAVARRAQARIIGRAWSSTGRWYVCAWGCGHRQHLHEDAEWLGYGHERCALRPPQAWNHLNREGLELPAPAVQGDA